MWGEQRLRLKAIGSRDAPAIAGDWKPQCACDCRRLEAAMRLRLKSQADTGENLLKAGCSKWRRWQTMSG
jgi:hypothetical protein